MRTEGTASTVTSAAARWSVVVPASLLALLGLLVTVSSDPFGSAGGVKNPVLLLGLTLAVPGTWSAVAGWNDPVRGVRLLAVPVVALELLLGFLLLALMWTSETHLALSPSAFGNLIVVTALALPPAYVLLNGTVRALQGRARSRGRSEGGAY